MNITKSVFVDFCNYPKLARWKVNNPKIYKKIRKIETEEQEESIMAIGQAVEDKVKDLLELEYNTIALDLMPRFHIIKDLFEDEDSDDEVLIKLELDLPKAIADTLQAIKDKVPVLYQPTFKYKDCLVRADFMVWNGSSYDLIEVKAKSGIRTKITDDGEEKPIGAIKSDLIADVSFQAYVINNVLAEHNMGQIGSIFLAYLNKEYIKQGVINIRSLIVRDLAGQNREIEVIQRNRPTTKIINDMLIPVSEVERKIELIKEYIALSEEEVNQRVKWGGIKYTEYFGEDKPFGTVMGMGIHHSNASHIQDLYYKGSISMSDLTDIEIDGFNDNGQQFIHKYLDCKKSGQPIIHEDTIKEIFDDFQYPICFYDYETISVPVPVMDTTRPYMQTIVQYSLHKYYEDGGMKHYGGVLVGQGEYSCTDVSIDSNPNRVAEEYDKAITGHYKDLLKQMLADIGDDIVKSTFIVRYKHFENTRNKDVAKLFPDLADDFLAINERTYDLMDIVAKGYYFDPACKGSASIKKVLPVLVPGMDYATLEIGRGDIAMRKLYDLIIDKVPKEEREQTIKNLLLYCGQDTLAMVRIYEALKELI